MYLQSIFDVIYVYYNNFEFDLKKFNLQLFFIQTFTSKFQWCPGIGWKVENIDLNLTVRHSMMQCFKTLILDLCNFLKPYTGRNAKFFESCERSQYNPSDQVKVAFTT
jgi:hypothetical protein